MCFTVDAMVRSIGANGVEGKSDDMQSPTTTELGHLRQSMDKLQDNLGAVATYVQEVVVQSSHPVYPFIFFV